MAGSSTTVNPSEQRSRLSMQRLFTLNQRRVRFVAPVVPQFAPWIAAGKTITAGKVTFHVPNYQQSSSLPEALEESISPGLPSMVHRKRKVVATLKRLFNVDEFYD